MSDFPCLAQVYAPITREGRVPARNQVVGYNIPMTSDFEGLSQLERKVPAATQLVQVARPEKIVPRGFSSRKGASVSARV